MNIIDRLKKVFRKSLRGLRRIYRRFKKSFRRLLHRFTKKQLIIILITGIAAVGAIALVIVSRITHNHTVSKTSLNTAFEDSYSDIATVSEDFYDEDIPVVETATDGTKVESTADTTVLAKKEGAKEGYLNRCVFLGDSRTVAMVNYGFFNDDAALAQIGISHPSFESNTFINNAGKEYTLKSYLGSHQAPVIYIALGVNGINDPSEEHYKSTFITLIDNVAEMAPNSNIVLMAIGPVDDNGRYKKTVQNSWIDKYNEFLLETAKEKHIFYLDITEVLKGDDGQVKSEYNGGDGLHYSGSGCEAIFNYIVEHPVPGIDDDGEYVVKYIKPDPNKTKVTMNDGSGIDQDNLQDLMDMMMGDTAATSTDKTSSSTTDAQSLQEQQAREEAARKASEEAAASKAASEAAARKASEEAAASKAASEAASIAAAEQPAAEQAAAEQAAAEPAAEQPAAEQPAAEQAAAEPAAEQVAAEQAAEEVAAEQAASQEATSQEATSQEAASQ
ncbi:MAG: hypothetical protein K6G03_02025 [Lachnospiraceae bacterium]|nr:hypothetical protein [Lachnospiraceae bacterium]